MIIIGERVVGESELTTNGGDMMKFFAIAAVLSFFFFGSEVVSADCSERCDHYHDYETV